MAEVIMSNKLYNLSLSAKKFKAEEPIGLTCCLVFWAGVIIQLTLILGVERILILAAN